MKVLSEILYKVPLVETAGDMNIEITDIQFDSRKVSDTSLFVATRGTQVDGHDFIDSVLDKGVKAIVCHKMPKELREGISYVQVMNSHLALGIIASNFYGKPSESLTVVAVTGTNGKTSNVTLLHSLFRELGYSVGMLSTVENKIDEEIIPSTHTTPDAVGLNALMAKMVERGCTHCFIEASSHAIDQKRIAGIKISGAVFTNISHDHLDYHETFDAYIKAKKALFDDLPKKSFALINADDRRANVMVQNCKAEIQFFGLKGLADFKGKIIDNTLQGLELEIDNKHVWFSLIGKFNAYNLLSVYGVAKMLGEDSDEILTCLSTIKAASGRFEQFVSDSKIIGIVDYAHTPDALDNVLSTIKELKGPNAKVITVVGCGGNRDKDKRPKMANIACEYSDQVVLTSDNPRNEKPEDIIQEMQEGVSIIQKRKVITLVDRREAIKLAGTFAQPGDVILVAGKGHESYQEINGERHHFDDKEELIEMFKLLGK